ncbi:MAG: 5-formyltetrahydrofolate cyclo-ligase [Nitrososphaerales archaeon]
MYSSKKALRETMLKTRDSFSKKILDKMSEMIQDRVLNMNEFVGAKTVAAYCSIGSEVKTSKILTMVLQMKKKLALPKVNDDTEIVLVAVQNLQNELEVGNYNIMEPKNHCVKINKIDLVLVPGIAWDEHGHRLGYSKGYYDRYLAGQQTTSVGLAYDFQLLEDIPHGKNDFRVNLIVTEKRIIKAFDS